MDTGTYTSYADLFYDKCGVEYQWAWVWDDLYYYSGLNYAAQKCARRRRRRGAPPPTDSAAPPHAHVCTHLGSSCRVALRIANGRRTAVPRPCRRYAEGSTVGKAIAVAILVIDVLVMLCLLFCLVRCIRKGCVTSDPFAAPSLHLPVYLTSPDRRVPHPSPRIHPAHL